MGLLDLGLSYAGGSEMESGGGNTFRNNFGGFNFNAPERNLSALGPAGMSTGAVVAVSVSALALVVGLVAIQKAKKKSRGR